MKNTIGKSIKVDPKLYLHIKELAKNEGREIKTLIDKAVENYLRAKKVLPLVCITKE